MATHYPVPNAQLINNKDFDCYRDQVIAREEENLYPKAAKSKEHTRARGAEDDHRLPYKRDVDRIVHSKAFSRYVDKTQVAYLIDNDHITQRSLHVQLVSNFARGIAEILRLNVDLVEAAALGHDVGHPPFGHEGEGYLSQLSEEHGEGPFAHPWQSCRLFTEIEPLNLGLAVYDGILCHDGGMASNTLEPRYGKTWDDHQQDLQNKIADPDKNILPGTLEGCLVKICDTMSYLGRDIEDAISLGIITRDQVPQTILGNTNREILNHLARDVILHSYDRDVIAFSEETLEALLEIRQFNFKHIYVDPRLKLASGKVKRAYRILFTHLLEDHTNNENNSFLWNNYLANKPSNYVEQTAPVRLVIDFISGMTDNYFVRMLEKIAIPTTIDWEKACAR